MYAVGLVAGLASVGAFCYFASAFAGRGYHRDRAVRLAAAGTFVVVSALKLTNPVHGAYFSTTVVTDPFAYVAFDPGTIHWTISAGAYVLAAVGLYFVYDTLADAGRTSLRMGLVFALLPAPVALDVAALLRPDLLIRTYYEPVGVAAFAIGLLWFIEGRLDTLGGVGRKHLVGQLDSPVCFVDDERVREANDRFVALVGHDVVGRPIGSLPESVRRTLDGDEETVTISTDGHRRQYRVSVSTVTLGPHRIGRAAIFADITDERRRMREVVRQNRELDNIGEALAHELRNACAITSGHLERAGEHAGPGGDPAVRSASLSTAAGGVDRIERVISQLETIVRDSRSVTSRSPVDLYWTATQLAGPTSPPLSVVDDGTLVGNPVRIDHLLENVFGLARSEGADELSLRMASGVLTIEFAGLSVPRTDEDLFGYGQSVPTADSGMYLPTIRLIAHAHHWHVDADVTGGDSPTLTVSIDTDPDTPPEPWDGRPLSPDTERTGASSPQES
ncbi:histidine kinase N-terminal 7TM domain-containing protein [Halobaculum litoreum]|uniref:Histidine kinase N-terminal 7TM domain-containing protein n=1 Tax=Halobaculum litoreum TaxID=3031998 RepID=A0ABD5XST4_9EURY